MPKRTREGQSPAIEKPKSPADKLDETRTDEVEWRGGLPIDLNRRMSGGQILKEKLTADISLWLNKELENQAGRIEKIEKWNKQYNGVKPPKSYPYTGCHNLSVPLSHYFTDATTVRVLDVIWGQQKVIVLKGMKQPFIDLAPQIEAGLDWWQKSIARLREKLTSPTLQGMKTGTGIVKVAYVRKKRTIYGYENGKITKKPVTIYDGPDVFPVSREDFVISSDAKTIDDAFLVGFRTYLREPEIKARVKQGFYIDGVDEKILGKTGLDETKQQRAETQDKQISPDTDKYALWELWLKYDVDDDGEEDDIVITFNKEGGIIARAIYNPFFTGFRPFVQLIADPEEFVAEGKGICQVLEPIQEAVDSILNQRLDRMDQINSLILLIRAGVGLDNFKLGTNLVQFVDDDPNTAIKEIKFSDQYPSTFQEEAALNQYAERLVGVGPYAMGQPSSERPVARETLALIQEMNKFFKYKVDNLRAGLIQLFWKVIELMAQYSPSYTYYVESAGKYEQKTIDFPFEYLRDGIEIDMAASSEMMNQEIRREIANAGYGLMSDFYTKLAGMVQAITSPQIPTEFKKFLILVSMVSAKQMTRILSEFGIQDADELILKLEDHIDLQKCLMMSVDNMPQQGREGSPEEAGGPPPEGGMEVGPGGLPPSGLPPSGLPPSGLPPSGLPPPGSPPMM